MPTQRRLCEVFCILQNLQMYEVPLGLRTAKPPLRCSGSPKGFRYIALLDEVPRKKRENQIYLCFPLFFLLDPNLVKRLLDEVQRTALDKFGQARRWNELGKGAGAFL